MSAAHHPGPWDISNPVQTDSLTIQCQGVTLASIDLGNATGDDLARLLASAKVMRAAPALLTLLNEVLQMVDDDDPPSPSGDWARQSRAIIAQAKGQA